MIHGQLLAIIVLVIAAALPSPHQRFAWRALEGSHDAGEPATHFRLGVLYVGQELFLRTSSRPLPGCILQGRCVRGGPFACMSADCGQPPCLASLALTLPAMKASTMRAPCRLARFLRRICGGAHRMHGSGSGPSSPLSGAGPSSPSVQYDLNFSTTGMQYCYRYLLCMRLIHV